MNEIMIQPSLVLQRHLAPRKCKTYPSYRSGGSKSIRMCEIQGHHMDHNSNTQGDLQQMANFGY